MTIPPLERIHPPTRADGLAESVRFELTVRCRITSFQDWLLKPLGQLSVCGLTISLKPKKVKRFPRIIPSLKLGVFGLDKACSLC